MFRKMMIIAEILNIKHLIIVVAWLNIYSVVLAFILLMFYFKEVYCLKDKVYFKNN